MRAQLNFKEGNFATVTRTAIILVLITIFFGCSREPEEVGTRQTNPTSFIFPYGRSELTSAIEECFGNFKYKGFSLCSKNGLAPVDTTTLFDQEGNLNDFYLHPSPGLPVGKSRQYLIDRDSIDYFASFHLHLTDVSGDRTRIDIFTIRPRVLVGESLLPKPPHFTRTLEYVDVPPTTIEEFEILLRLGRCLGVQGMPELRVNPVR
jgi:hypothetical protein